MLKNTAPRATYKVRAKVWLYNGNGGWHFLTLPAKQAAAIRALFATGSRPFGSLPVSVTIGGTEWRTSLFPDKKAGSYLLPIKADVRKSEQIEDGMMVSATIHIL